MENDRWARRSFMSAAGATVASLTLGSARANAQTRAFQSTRHQQDAWMDAVAGKHRTIVDCSTVSGAGEGILYANNLYVANKSGYQLDEKDVAVVVCLRHFATVFAYNDAIWGKYGKALSEIVQFTDPKTKQAPSTNLLNSADYGLTMANFGNTIQSVVTRGTQFAVCDMATHFLSGAVAGAVKASPDDLYKEFAANLIPNSHLVPAGVVAVTRAQEYGYAVLTAL